MLSKLKSMFPRKKTETAPAQGEAAAPVEETLNKRLTRAERKTYRAHRRNTYNRTLGARLCRLQVAKKLYGAA